MSKVKPAAMLAGLWLGMVPLAARPQSAPVITAPDAETDREIGAWLADADAPSNTAPVAAPSTAPMQDRAIHGEAEVGLGSNGDRLARVSAVVPVGTDGELGLALADEALGGRRGHSDHKSVALSLQLGEGVSSEPCGLRHTGVPLASDLRQDSVCARPGAPSAIVR